MQSDIQYDAIFAMVLLLRELSTYSENSWSLANGGGIEALIQVVHKNLSIDLLEIAIDALWNILDHENAQKVRAKHVDLATTNLLATTSEGSLLSLPGANMSYISTSSHSVIDQSDFKQTDEIASTGSVTAPGMESHKRKGTPAATSMGSTPSLSAIATCLQSLETYVIF